eukprot:10672263-Karenia_brevis.AAC.1
MVVLARYGEGNWSPLCWGWSPLVLQLQEHARLEWVGGLAGIGPRSEGRAEGVKASLKSVLDGPSGKAIQKQLSQ